jgi:hypothetical protein
MATATAQMESKGSRKRAGGRPPTKSPAVCQRILEGVSSGLSLRKAAAQACVTERTISRWCNLDAQFAAELESARMAGFQAQNRSKAEKHLCNLKKRAADKRDKTGLAINSKKTPEAIERALETAKSGLPLRFCAAAAHVSLETLGNWREQDPDFAQSLESARAEGVRKKWDKILAAGDRDAPGSWQPLAWALERGFAAEFSRPEIQLAAVHQSNFTTNNTLAISVEMAASLQARAEPVRKKIEQLFSSHTSGREASVRQLEASMNGDQREAEMKLPALQMPAGKLSVNWWGQLTRGDNTREVEPAAAVKICRMILEDVLGQARAKAIEVEFDSGPILLRDLHAKLEGLCGQRGWDALVKRGKTHK